MPLKPIDKDKNPGLAKLPTDVRNKMGYMKDGGVVGKSAKVKELDDIIKELRDGSSDMSSEALRTLKSRIKYNLKKKADGGMATKRKAPDSRKKLPSEERQWAPTSPKKLPPEVRNKMGYKKDGGMVLEIGLRPATKSEMKMAKAVKKADGGMVRGTGKAITGKGFKGVF